MKKQYVSPEFEFKKINLSYDILGDSNPEIIKEDGEIIEETWDW